MKKIYFLSLMVSAVLVCNSLVAQLNVLETFEESANVPEWANANEDAPQPEIVANPKKEGINPSDSVMLWIKAKDAPVYAAAMTELEAYDIEFLGDVKYMHVKMMKDNTDPCALQVIRTEDGATEAGKYLDPPIRIPCPTPNDWVDYVFDFSAPEATDHSWSRLYFMAVMNATEDDGWTADPLDNDVNVYFDDITIDSDMDPYTSSLPTSIYVNKMGQISYILNNPVTDELILQGIGKMRNITIYSINGQAVKQIMISNHERYIIPVGDLARGIYLIKFQKETGAIETSKIIKK